MASGVDWKRSGEYEDIVYETAEGIAKITINRPERHNAFRPTTLFELREAFNLAQEDTEVGVIILTGAGDRAFCSGGDQKIRGDDGYVDDKTHGIGRLNVLDLQVQIRRCPKPVIAMVAGYAIGGGHVLHVCCDLTIAADNARFGQTGPKVGSFDGGYGSWLLAETVGLKRARETGTCAASTTRRPPCSGAWSTPSSRWSGWRRRPSSGPANCWRSRRSRCACSRARSTRSPTARPACSSSPVTPRSSTT